MLFLEMNGDPRDLHVLTHSFPTRRSADLKPNSGTNREIRGATYVNLSAQYNLTDNVQLKLQALNVTGTNDIMVKGGYDSIAEVSRSGTQYFFGFRVRL